LDSAIKHFKLSGDTGDSLHNLVLFLKYLMPLLGLIYFAFFVRHLRFV